MAGVDVNAYATTSTNTAAGAPNVIETQQPGGTGSLRQVVSQGDPITRGNIQTVKGASTAAVASDMPGVVAFHPSSPLPVGANLIGTTIDANKQSVTFYAQMLTAGATITPTAGKKIKLVKAQVHQSPDNTTANPVTLSFVSVGNFCTGWAYSDSCEATGAVNEIMNITLGNAQSVAVNIRYKEI